MNCISPQDMKLPVIIEDFADIFYREFLNSPLGLEQYVLPIPYPSTQDNRLKIVDMYQQCGWDNVTCDFDGTNTILTVSRPI